MVIIISFLCGVLGAEVHWRLRFKAPVIPTNKSGPTLFKKYSKRKPLVRSEKELWDIEQKNQS